MLLRNEIKEKNVTNVKQNQLCFGISIPKVVYLADAQSYQFHCCFCISAI